MKKILKYPIQIADEFELSMPVGALLLSVHTQADEPKIWALVDPDAETAVRRFSLRATGEDVTGLNPGWFVSTFQIQGGSLVFHLFDRGEA